MQTSVYVGVQACVCVWVYRRVCVCVCAGPVCGCAGVVYVKIGAQNVGELKTGWGWAESCAGLCVCRPLCLCVCVCAGLCVCVCVCSPVAFTLDRVGSDPDWTDGSTSIILI